MMILSKKFGRPPKAAVAQVTVVVLKDCMRDDLLIPAVIAALIVCLWLALRIWYANYRAGMTVAERNAQDRLHDSDQIW